MKHTHTHTHTHTQCDIIGLYRVPIRNHFSVITLLLRVQHKQ
jgi:hypothetical protein